MIYITLITFTSWLLTLTLGQNLVLIGGNLRVDNAIVWEKMVKLAGGQDVARIGVVSASDDVTTEGDRVIGTFLRLGVKVTGIPVNESRVNDTAVVNIIMQQTGIFIVEDSEDKPDSFWNRFTSLIRPTGSPGEPPMGVVCYETTSYKRQNLLETLRPSGVDSPVLRAIQSVLKKGGMVAGNAAIMGKAPVIISGDSISSLLAGTRFFSSPRDQFLFRKEGGLALLNMDYVIDSHLSEKGREMRTIRTLLESNITRGIGVDENTALVVNNPLAMPVGKVVTALGVISGVFYVDVSMVPAVSMTNALYENVIFSFFTVDDSLDFTSGKVIYPSWKKRMFGLEQFKSAVPSDDIFSLVWPSQWRQTALRLMNCNEMNVTSHSPASIVPLVPGVTVVFDRSGAVGFAAHLPDNFSNTYVISFQGMSASVKVLRIL
ncbi:cyanophycinase-like [Daphnia pulicaria]|uniref:cyanophycinase-like n=1 Tax=Daphnia pulicaria TaxID=35523 RepID=UPI001EEC83AA|nr:cyanophycinase-like [Daphnia pulicaria]